MAYVFVISNRILFRPDTELHLLLSVSTYYIYLEELPGLIGVDGKCDARADTDFDIFSYVVKAPTKPNAASMGSRFVPRRITMHNVCRIDSSLGSCLKIYQPSVDDSKPERDELKGNSPQKNSTAGNSAPRKDMNDFSNLASIEQILEKGNSGDTMCE